MKSYKIAVIAGDGIGKEVMPEGLRVLHTVASKFNFELQFDEFDWSCHNYEKHGWWMPPSWREDIGGHDSIFFGANGWPALVPDHKALWDSIIKWRREFDQYVNLRPVKLLPGVKCPLAGLEPGDIDYLVVRENTEGEYSSIGGRMFEGTDRETVTQQSVFTRKGVDRIMRYAFGLAEKRDRKHVTSATKSNGIAITMPYWDERFKLITDEFPSISTDQYHIDGLTIQLILNPQRFDVIVASNLFGDIISDIGPATAGTIGIAPSANINPERIFPSLFEPVHGSAPDIYGQNISNPIAQIWSGAMMLDHLGEQEAARAVTESIEACLVSGPVTPDLGGTANTSDVGQAISNSLT
jgi:tartrate dehydrogenase/decarboxylase/D-malate dehydrogenase